MTNTEEQIDEILNNLCDYCEGKGYIETGGKSIEDDLIEKEPCPIEIHDLIPTAKQALLALIVTAEREARIHERKQVALDNYIGQTFSGATNWEGKFQKFIDNNDKRLANLTINKPDRNKS